MHETKPASLAYDRPAAGSTLDSGDPAAPADKSVIEAADGPIEPAGGTASDLSPNKPAAKAANQKSPTAGVSDTREQRLREVAADFDRRRDEAQYQAALNRWREDDAAGCREALQQLLNRSPNHCPARLLLADVELSAGSAKTAMEQARQVLVLEPENAEAHHVMGLALDALGETGPAIAQYEQATRLDSKNDQYAACYHAALDASIPPGADANRQPDAIPSDAMPADPAPAEMAPPLPASAGTGSPGNAPPSSLSLATIRPEDFESTDRTASRFAANRTGNANPADETDAADRVVQASATAPQASDSDDSPEVKRAVSHATEALRENHPQNAIEVAKATLAGHPKAASLYRVLGAAEYRAGDFPAAQVAIAQALSLDKSDALAYFLMGSTLARLGQAEAAKRQFAEAARLDPRFAEIRD
ncbi:MAG TPA: tetratricopeptide repeat protein [Pirellulales bacterium]|nr:tetratricopeptide repeat protein [Pirellulales bacterium]